MYSSQFCGLIRYLNTVTPCVWGWSGQVHGVFGFDQHRPINHTDPKMQQGLRIALLQVLNITHSRLWRRINLPHAMTCNACSRSLLQDSNGPRALRTNERFIPLYAGKRITARSYCKGNSNENQGSEVTMNAHPSDKAASQDSISYLEARRRGVLQGRRRLSPFQRVGGMIGGSEFVNTMDSGFIEHSDTGDEQGNKDTLHKDGISQNSKSSAAASLQPGVQSSSSPLASHAVHVTSQSPLLVDGEYVIVMRENMKRQEKLVRLIKLDANLEFKSKFGNLLHEDIIGGRNGSIFVTGMDIELLVRRPSLEEFVLYMKRTPVIAYPKDCCSMLMMIDAAPGDVVLEAGSGSGAMTLFLSRAVGHSGKVLSFERVDTHQKKARTNFASWQRSWDLSHDVTWPSNVSFHQARLEDCGRYIGDVQVDGAIIDMEEPWRVMKTVSERLKTGKAMAVYVANLTQVVDIAEAIRKQRLPLILETTLEVSHKVWVVNPARRHAGNVLGESILTEGEDCEDGETVKGVQYVADEVPKYLTRPHHLQPSHTAFLVKIRRVLTSSSTFKV